MHIDSFFACSNSKLEEADFIIFGIPYDATQSFKPGSRFAPNAIREASWNLEDYSFFSRFPLYKAKICDAGNVNTDGTFEEIIERVSNFMRSFSGIPIALGGEHSISYAVARNVSNACFVIFDAHLDMRSDFDGNPYSHACTARRIYELGNEVVLIGVRSCSEEELEFAESEGIEIYSALDILTRGIDFIFDKINAEKIYLSVDMDAFDPAFAPGVSTPEPFGLNPLDLLRFINNFSGKIVGMDIVEVVPDTEKVTQTLAARLVVEFIARKCISSSSH